MPDPEVAPEPAAAPEGTALDDGGAPPAGTALDAGTEVIDPDAPLVVPEKFRGEDGKLNEQGILKSYKELETKIGSGGTPPESADGYKIELEGKFPEGVEIDADGQKEFLGRCHEKGMSNEMVQFVMDEYTGIVTGAVAQHAHTRESTVETLKGLFGDKYSEKMHSAMNAFRAAGIEGMDINKVGNNPDMIQILSVLGENLTEDQLPNSMLSIEGGMSADELDAVMKSPAYFDSKHADHKATVAKVTAHFKAEAARRKKK